LDQVAALAPSDSYIMVGDGSAWIRETGSTARTSLGLGTGDSPAFTGLSITGTLTGVYHGTQIRVAPGHSGATDTRTGISSIYDFNRPFSTLAAAVAVAVSGDTIYLPKLVIENITVTDKSLTIIGPGGIAGKVTVDASTGATLTLIDVDISNYLDSVLVMSGSGVSTVYLRGISSLTGLSASPITFAGGYKALSIGTGSRLITYADFDTSGGAVSLASGSLVSMSGNDIIGSGTVAIAGAAILNDVGSITANAVVTSAYEVWSNIFRGNSIDEAVADAGVTVENILFKDGAIADEVIFSGIETILAGETTTALSLTKTVHHIDADAGGDIFTVADGTVGQIITIAMDSYEGLATVTPANLAGDAVSVTMDAAGATVMLQFIDTDWYVIGGNSYTLLIP